MTPDETPTERVTLALVYSEIAKMRSEFRDDLESLRCKIDNFSTVFVTQTQFNERGRRFDGDFEQVRHDVETAKREAEGAMNKAKAEADARVSETNGRIDSEARALAIIQEELAVTRGKASQNSVNIATVLAVLGILFGAAGILLRLIGR